MKLSMNISALLLALASVLTADGQPGRRRLDLRGQVFDLVFPTHSERSYFSKMVLRFSDTQSQLTVLVYTGGQTEIIRHRMSGVTAAELNGLTVKAFQDNTITPASIASKLKVDMSRVSVDYEQTVVPALEELKTIRLSPLLTSRVALDDFAEYEFWYDTWQECVHYTIVGPYSNSPQDDLAKWMLRFRDRAEQLLKGQ